MAFVHPDYTIVRELGRGGSATVYLAVQNSLNRRVALKVMTAITADPAQGQRFLREGRIVAKLRHPHIVPVYDVGRVPEDGAYFMAMEYLPGGSLTERVETFTLDDLFRTIRQICDALGYAHAQGFVHRDVKPDNILFRTSDEALLADFGIARSTESSTRMTMTGAMLGTPAYMSPEQVTGGDVDNRTDLYSLGIVLFELLAGYKPLQGDSVMSTGLQHIAATPLPLPDNVAHFQPLIDRLLAKKPEQRLEGAHELTEQLDGLVETWSRRPDQRLVSLHSGEEPQRATLESTLGTDARRPSRFRQVTAGVVVVAAVAAGVYAFNNLESPPTQPLVSRSQPTLSQSQPTAPAPTPVDLALQAGDEAFRLDRWFGDGPETAVAEFRRVLSLEPGNATAEGRLDDIFETTAQRTSNALAAGDIERANVLLDDLTQAWPDDSRLEELDRQLQVARADGARRDQETADAARIAGLLAAAAGALSNGDLVTPVGSDAASYYRQVLAIENGNTLAVAGLSTIANQLFTQASAALAQNEFGTAEGLVEAGRDLAPDHPQVAQLLTDVAAAREQYAATVEERRSQAELAALVDALASRVDQWVASDTAALDDVFETLAADIEALLLRAPDHRELQNLKTATLQHAEVLAADDPEAEDNDRFRFGGF